MTLPNDPYIDQKIEQLLMGFNTPQPDVKIYQSNGERAALRVEAPFIRGVSMLAKKLKMKPGAFVLYLKKHYKKNIEPSDNKGKNFTSFLRALCMAEAEKDLMAMDAMGSSQNLDYFLSPCPVPALVLTKDQDIQFANPAFFRWVSTKPDEFREKKFIDLFHIKENQSLRDVLNRVYMGIQSQAVLDVTYVGDKMNLGATAIFTPYTDTSGDRISFIVWLQTSHNQRPARIIKIPKRPS